MKRKYTIASLTVILISAVCGFRLIEDPEFLNRVRQELTSYHRTLPEEKIYLHFDKPFYKPGEDLWFSAFVLNGTTHKPTHTSDVLHVELIDPKGNVSSRLELFIREGTASGDFQIPPTAPGGIYQVKAYTHWTKNFPERLVFTKSIQVQRVITPRMLFKFDFERKAYGPGDEVSATLSIRNLKNELIPNAQIKMLIDLDGARYHEATTSSDLHGFARLTFTLPDALRSPDGLLQAVVTSDGQQESISRTIPILLNRVAIEFFPEGGEWLEGQEASIAFKASNEYGKGADVKGVVVDDMNQQVTTFESFHMGMGAFRFTGEAGRKYYAVITSPSGNENRIALPAPEKNALVLQLNEKKKDNIIWSVRSNVTGTAYLVAHSHGAIHHAQTVSLKKGRIMIDVPVNSFPAGIAVFTLFDANGTPKAERLTFINKDKKLNISITSDKDIYLPGEKVALTIASTDAHGNPVPARISLSVVDDQLIAFADDKQDNLISHMLLSSEVKGEIQEPSFYFDPKEPRAEAALDYLLMTQGWRRFTWQSLTELNKPLAFLPEKVKTVAGRVINKSGQPKKSEVTLLELASRKRILKVETTPDGHFAFRNIDPTVPILLLTDRQGEITLQKEKYNTITFNAQPAVPIAPVPGEAVFFEADEETIIEKPQLSERGLDIAMGADVSQLSEVIVTGYGMTEAKSLTGSVGYLNMDGDALAMRPLAAMENHLQGRVAGVQVVPGNIAAGAATRLHIRGMSSIAAGKGDPLFVIDGHPIGTSINFNFANGSFLNPEEIESIRVLPSPEATAIYGSEAANGVILITTRNGIDMNQYQPKKETPAKYSSVLITPRNFSKVREFYVPETNIKQQGKRTDFRSTVYWNPVIMTNEKGAATVTFRNNDAVSAFRITAEGFTGAGLLGRTEHVYSTQLPFSLDAKIPGYIGYEDVLELPVVVKNETAQPLKGKINIEMPSELKLNGNAETIVHIAPNTAETFWFTIASRAIAGSFPITIKLKAAGREDEINHTITVQPVGFPVRLSFSGNQLERNVRFTIRDAERGSLKATLSVYPDVLSDLITGVESIFREPYGCFEQTSSSTFPNILALQYLRNSGNTNPAVEAKALRYIENGYKRLISFEVKGGGFDWFGKPAAHEALTAYGLVEFHEMKKVYPAVDDKMVERTREWLLNRRKGDGTYLLHSRGLDDFSRPSGDVSNAYITYALSETGSKDIDREYTHNLGKAWQSKDMYQLGLMANVAYNLQKKSDYERLIDHFERTTASAMDNVTASHSVVWSQGQSLTNETISLWALALMKEGTRRFGKVQECINFISARRSFGMFGSTQATVLSLKALSEYALLARSTSASGDVVITVNGEKAQSVHYAKDTRDKIELTGFGHAFTANGDQNLKIQFANTQDALPYSTDIEWYTKSPQSSSECKVSLTTRLHKNAVNINETVRLTIQLTNKTRDGLPMTMAITGIPAGLSVQPWQLKELQEKEVFDFYEINEGKLILYYRQMKASETKTVNLDLKAEVKGTFTGAASSAYLYYTNEYKHWTQGISIAVR
jgi:alpha-2-macroglobulin-like protein